MNIDKLKLRVSSFGLATIMAASIALPAKCEEITNKINSSLPSINEIIEILDDYDFAYPFEKTNGSSTDFNSELNRFNRSLIICMDTNTYNDDVRETARGEANAALFYVSRQVLLNLIADNFDTSIFSIKTSKENNGGNPYYVITYSNGIDSGTYYIDPLFKGETNPLYDYIVSMEGCYSHRLSPNELILYSRRVGDVIATQKIIVNSEDNGLSFTFDKDKSEEIERDYSRK